MRLGPRHRDLVETHAAVMAARAGGVNNVMAGTLLGRAAAREYWRGYL
jgi:hypothetical protein